MFELIYPALADLEKQTYKTQGDDEDQYSIISEWKMLKTTSLKKAFSNIYKAMGILQPWSSSMILLPSSVSAVKGIVVL